MYKNRRGGRKFSNLKNYKPRPFPIKFTSRVKRNQYRVPNNYAKNPFTISYAQAEKAREAFDTALEKLVDKIEREKEEFDTILDQLTAKEEARFADARRKIRKREKRIAKRARRRARK